MPHGGVADLGVEALHLPGQADAEIAKGRLPIVHVRPRYLFPGTDGGHYTGVTAVRDGKVYLNDSASKTGPIVSSEAAFNEAIRGRGTFAMISAGR